MDTKYENEIYEFFFALQEQAIKDMQDTDLEYNKLINYESEYLGKLEQLINTLGKENVEIFEKYIRTTFEVSCKNLDCVYLAGYKDCIKFLKKFQII